MKSIIGAANKASESVGGVGDNADDAKDKLVGLAAIDLFAIKDAVGSLAAKFNELNAPGAAFNAQMKEVEAITGVTGAALDDLGAKARRTAKDFGGDASAMMESYKGILSRLGPDIANNQEALEGMGRSVATLSKTMGNDATGSMDALTTAMLQFGVDLSDPQHAAQEMTRMMNVMAAGAKWGASEVPQISQALKQAGTEAQKSNVSFEETNAALQALAAGGKYGSEAGVALRNVLGKMAGIDVIPKEAAEKLQSLGVNYDIVSDKTLPLTTRLRELAKAQGDGTAMAQVFGTENAAAATILVRSVDAQDKMTESITGTNTATEQAEIIMSGYNETMGRMKAWFTDLGIGMFDVTSKIAPMMDGLSGAVSMFADLANARKGVMLLFKTLQTMPVIGKLVAFGSSVASGGFAAMSTAAKALGVAIMNIPIIGWIAALIAALIAVGTYFYKTSATFRGVLMGVWEFIKVTFTGFYKFIWEVMKAIHHVIMGVFDPRNWFDDNYNFSDAFDKVIASAKEYGKNLSEAYGKGRAEGEESFYQDNPDQRPGAVKQEGQKSGGVQIKGVSPVLKTTDLNNTSKTKTQDGLSGSGGSSIKNISQKIDIKNYFNISPSSNKADFDAMAEQVVRAINDKLRDGMVAAS